MSKQISGIVPIVAATFTSLGSLDEDSFQELVRHLIPSGASALTLFGLASEFYKLTDDERARMQTLLRRETVKSDPVDGLICLTDTSFEWACTSAEAMR